VRLIPAEELEPHLEEAFPSSLEERLALSREVVGGLDFPFPETLLEPLLDETSRPVCFYGRATVGGEGLVLLRLGNVAALAEGHSHSLFPESWEVLPTFSAFRIKEWHLVDLARLGWREGALGLARALKAWAEARGLRFPDRPFSALPRFFLDPFATLSGFHVLWVAHEWPKRGVRGDLVLFSPYWALAVRLGAQSEGEAAKSALRLYLDLATAADGPQNGERAEERFLDHLPGFLASRGLPPEVVLDLLRGRGDLEEAKRVVAMAQLAGF
jgi:hypothetical protein